MRSLLCFAAALALIGPVPTSRAGGNKPVSDRDVQDMVYSGGKKPLLIRVHVFIDGKPLLDVWDEFMGKLFAYLDVNGDGVLSKEEAGRAPSPQALSNPLAFFQGRYSYTPLAVDKVTKAELSKWYLHYGASPFQFRNGPAQMGGQLIVLAGGQRQPLSAKALTEKLFALLDSNKDRKLDRKELARASSVLQKLDADDDETVSIDEMSGIAPTDLGANVFVAATVESQTVKNGGPFTLLDRKESRKRTPDVELRIRIGKKAAKEPAIEVIAPKTKSPLTPSIRTVGDGSLVLDCGPTQIEWSFNVDARFGFAVRSAPQQRYIAAFRSLDRDKSGYLDAKEAAQLPFYSGVFPMMDRDGDGKLYEKEVMAYLAKMKELQDIAVRSCVALSVQDQGRGLFDWIDADKDGRLSVRELRQITERIASFDLDGDGRISREDIPRKYRLTVRQGPAQGNAYLSPARAFRVANRGAPNRPEPTNGPKWFRKMDRNRDGDVSRREFLGSDKEFRLIDADGDGLLSRAEAEQADAKWRNKTKTRP